MDLSLTSVLDSMTSHASRRTLLASVGTLALAGCLAGDRRPARKDTPTPPNTFGSEWPVPAADPGLTNYAAGADGPTDRVDDLWQHSSGTTLSHPVFVDETVYVAGVDGTVRALDARFGEERWRQSVGAVADPPWTIDDRLYVPTGDGLVALDRRDGAEVWRVGTPGRAVVTVASHGIYWVDEQIPAVVALDHDDGTERWRTDVSDPWEPTLFASDESVFLSSGPHDFRFWRFTVATGEGREDEPRHGNDFPAEQIYMNGIVYAVDAFFGNVRATAVQPEADGWTAAGPHGGEAGGGLLSGGTERVYYTTNVDDEPNLHAVSTTDGTVEWAQTIDATITGRPVVADETILLPTERQLRCIDVADGRERWRHSEIGSQCIIVDDVVYTAEGGTVQAFR